MSIDLTGVRIEGFSTPPFPAFFYGARTRLPCREQADLFSALEVQKKEQFVVRALQIWSRVWNVSQWHRQGGK
jgi:hypothetical protein